MRAALLVEPRRIELCEIPPPAPGSGEVLIRLVRAGICGSDLSFFDGHREAHYPHLLGHELVGRVVATADDVAGFATGARVVVEPNYPCGTCALCRSGRSSICPEKKSMGVDLPGCFAKYAVAPARFVWALPDSISDEDGATIEPLAVALHALDQSRASEGDSVAVVGCGGIGQLLIHAARARGVRVLADDQSEAKLERARQLGAITTARGTDTARLWREMEVSAVFECAGSSSAVERAIDAAPRGGKVLLLGLSSSLASFVPLHLVRKGVRIEPSLIYDHPVDFARAIDLVAEGTLHPSCVVSSAFPFDEIGHAFEVACAGPESKVHSLIL